MSRKVRVAPTVRRDSPRRLVVTLLLTTREPHHAIRAAYHQLPAALARRSTLDALSVRITR